MWFILGHVVWFVVWMALNLRGGHGLAFDPFPFPLLTMIVSLESIFLSLFILMSQNRSGLQADQRNHLDLQINLLSEREMTIVLQLLQQISQRLGVGASGAHIDELIAETSVEALAQQISEKLQDE